MRAGRERQVHSPLAECELTKAEIRQLRSPGPARLGQAGDALPKQPHRLRRDGDAPRLAMIGAAESFFREHGFQPLRVRYHKGDVARIEVSPDALPRLLEPDFREEVVETEIAGLQVRLGRY